MPHHYKVGPSAYGIPLLHAAKYSSGRVCGVLLGKSDGEDTWEITHAVPLFHHWTTLTPMLEIALTQVATFAAKLDCAIVGFYQANEHKDDTNLQDNVIKVADTIRKNTGHAVVFIVDNEKLAHAALDKSAIMVHAYQNGQWSPAKQITLTDEGVLAKVCGKLSTSGYRDLVDFDDHLENVSLDWLNSIQL